jgi:glycine cleavage system H protein
VEFPQSLRYSREHEWVRREGDEATIGITDFAQDALGDVVYVALPEIGAEVDIDGTCGEIESTKSVSEVYAPVAGTVIAVNDALGDHPEFVNGDPYGDGWLARLRLANPADVDALMDADAYREFVEG